MKNTKAEAKAYNDTIKNKSIEYKLELLYIDLIAYVANELGEEKMEAIEKVVNTFKIEPYPWIINDEIEFILYGYNRVKYGHPALRYFKAHIKAELEEAKKMADEYYLYFYENLEESLNKIIDNYSDSGESLESKVTELEAKKEK